MQDEIDNEEIEEGELEKSESAPFFVIEPKGPPLKRYAAGRRCKCGAKLSIYNPGERCWPCQHKEIMQGGAQKS